MLRCHDLSGSCGPGSTLKHRGDSCFRWDLLRQQRGLRLPQMFVLEQEVKKGSFSLQLFGVHADYKMSKLCDKSDFLLSLNTSFNTSAPAWMISLPGPQSNSSSSIIVSVMTNDSWPRTVLWIKCKALLRSKTASRFLKVTLLYMIFNIKPITACCNVTGWKQRHTEIS